MAETTPEQRTAIARVREIARVSQYDVADATGMSQSKLSLYESGHVDLTPQELKKVESFLVKQFSFSESYRGKKNFQGIAALVMCKNALASYGMFSVRLPHGDVARRRVARKGAGLSQHALASAAGINQSKLSRWESGKCELTASEKANVDQALKEAERKKFVNDPYFKLEAVADAHRELFQALKRAEEQLRIQDEQLRLKDEQLRGKDKYIETLHAERDTLRTQNAELREWMDKETLAAIKHAEAEAAREKLEVQISGDPEKGTSS